MRDSANAILILSLLVASRLTAQTAPVDSFYAPSIGSMARFSYILPEQYDSTRSYPILYLLHGYTGDYTNWTTLTDLATYAPRSGIIVIMPDGANSWYVNSVSKPADRYEDLIASDLRTHAEKRFSADTTRRGIAGLSMGGYGAIMLSLRHPRLYRFAASLSGALSIPGGIGFPERNKPERALNVTAFGNDKMLRRRYDPFFLYKETPAGRLPYLYFVIGTNDGFTTFLPAHRALTDSLRAYGAAYEYHETPGEHSWKFWGKEIRMVLQRMTQILSKSSH